jgi:predicted nucleic acid-binding protein
MRMVSSGGLTLCLDARILSEYDEVLRRPKFRFRIDKVAALLDPIEHSGTIVASSPLSDPLPDSDDQPFLEVALAGQAACLVTGNHAHFPRERRQGVKVLSPSEFLTFYRSQQKSS